MKLSSDSLALFLGFSWIFFCESTGSPYFGFYAIPASTAVFLYFYSPLISREINAVAAFFLGVFLASIINFHFVFFTVPFFLILSLILYVFAKK